MWKQFFDALSNLFVIMQRVERQKKEIKELRQELKEVMAAVQKMSWEQRRTEEREVESRKTLLLEVENRILRAKLRLPPATDEPQE